MSQNSDVSDANIMVRIPSKLKTELQKELAESGDIPNMTAFFLDCARCYVLQRRRREMLAYPLEFVSDKSSDKTTE